MSRVEKESIVVTIAGKRYLLNGYDDKDYVQRIADLTDRRIRETQVANPALNREEAAVSAALSLSDELMKANRELLQMRRRGKQTGAGEKS